jgi:hypothetical protein
MSNLSDYITSLDVVGYWRFDELTGDAVDSVGSNDLAWGAAPTRVDGLVSNEPNGKAVLLDDDVAAVGTLYNLTDNFSCSVVVTLTPEQQNGFILMNGSGLTGWALAVSSGAMAAEGFFLHAFYGGASANPTSSSYWIFPGVRYHIVLVRRAGTTELWVNGQKESESATYSVVTPEVAFILGAANDGTLKWDGEIDELAIFDAPLTLAQIRTITELVFYVAPTPPVLQINDNGAGQDEIVLAVPAGNGTNTVDGYSLWESTSGGTADDFDFDGPPAQTITASGSFSLRGAASGKYYAVKAFDDATTPIYSEAAIAASVGVSLTDLMAAISGIGQASDTEEILTAFKADPDFGTTGLLADATTAAENVVDTDSIVTAMIASDALAAKLKSNQR